MSTASTDRIERQIHIRAPRAKVWQSLTDAPTFGQWFGAKLSDQQFREGERARGPITICNFEHVMFDVIVERIQPQTRFVYRWHPYAVEPQRDYESETPTRVEFTLADADDGTLLTVVESGFDQLPPERRLDAFRANSGGWEAQLRNIQRHASPVAA